MMGETLIGLAEDVFSGSNTFDCHQGKTTVRDQDIKFTTFLEIDGKKEGGTEAEVYRVVGIFTDYEMAQLNDIASGNCSDAVVTVSGNVFSEEQLAQMAQDLRGPDVQTSEFNPRKKLSKEEFTEMCGHCKYRGNE